MFPRGRDDRHGPQTPAHHPERLVDQVVMRVC